MTAWAAFVQQRLERLQHPDTLLYWPYVASALVITLFFLTFVSKMTLGGALRAVVSPGVWLTRSTRTDVVMTVTHEMFVLAPTLALAAFVSNTVLAALRDHIARGAGALLPWTPPVVAQSAIATILVMLAIDLGTFIAHRMHHSFPFLWDLHAVHHSAEQLTLFTAHRLHPIEALLRAVVQGVLTGSVLFALRLGFGQIAPVVTVWGLGVGFFVHMFTNNLLHSHVPVRYPKWLRPLVLSPHIHHLHHSRRLAHRNNNFGAMFPYWDKLCGTYLDVEFEIGELPFGLDAPDDPFNHSIARCYLYPLVAPLEKAFRLARTSTAPATRKMRRERK